MIKVTNLFSFLCVEKGDSYDQSGKLLLKNQISTFIVGAGNYGGKTKASDEVKPAISAPDRPFDTSVKYTTSVDQAALYRWRILSFFFSNQNIG